MHSFPESGWFILQKNALDFCLSSMWDFEGKALEFAVPFEVANDQQKLVLEIQQEGSKSMKDSERATLRALLQELEESDIMDCTVCAHHVVRLSPMEGGGGGAALLFVHGHSHFGHAPHHSV